MESFLTLEDAKSYGLRIAKRGCFPTIYKCGNDEYMVVMKGEWPPGNSWPFLKWIGGFLCDSTDLGTDGWVPVLAKLDTLQRAQDACGLFSLLGLDPIVVQFPGITFDIFLNETHVPVGARVILEIDEDRFYDSEETESIELRMHPI